MRLAAVGFLLRGRPCFDPPGAVETGVDVVHNDRPVVDVGHVHVHVHHRAVIEEGAASPLAAAEAYAAVAEAVVNAAVEADVRSPVASVPAVEAAGKTLVARSPEHAHRPDYPCAGNPVVAAVVIPSPVTRRPEISWTGADGLCIDGQSRRTDAHRDANSNLCGRWG